MAVELAKGWGGFVVLHLAWRKDSLSTHVDTRVEPRKFRKRGATWKWRATLAAPLNGLTNHAKPEIGSDFGGFAADRGQL